MGSIHIPLFHSALHFWIGKMRALAHAQTKRFHLFLKKKSTAQELQVSV